MAPSRHHGIVPTNAVLHVVALWMMSIPESHVSCTVGRWQRVPIGYGPEDCSGMPSWPPISWLSWMPGPWLHANCMDKFKTMQVDV